MAAFASQSYAERIAGVQNRPANVSDNLPPPLFGRRLNIAKQVNDKIVVRFLNVEREIGIPIDWHPAEMKTGTRLWLLNLHYMEFLESLPENQWSRVVLDWIEQNKPYKPGYWMDDWNSYSLSIRVVVWMQLFQRYRSTLEPEQSEKIVNSLLAQVRFLSANLELDIGGNHIIKNIKALLWASAFFEGEEAKQWHKTGMRLLKQEIQEQITADGMHYELSPAYHLQVFVDLLECQSLIQNEPFGKQLKEILDRMAQTLCDFTHPDGKVSLFNDGALTTVYTPSECIDVYESLSGKRPNPSEVIQYSVAGYYGRRCGDSLVLFDCAALAPDFLPAHGHGDALSLEWSVAGSRVLIDPGVFEYNPGPMRDFSRATSSHNTLTLDSLDQSEFWKAFRVGRRAKITSCAATDGEGFFEIEAAHDGYQRLAGNPIHHRKIRITDSELHLHDEIIGGAGQKVESRFMVSPDVDVRMENGNCELTLNETKITLLTSGTISLNDSFCFPDFGVKSSTTQIVIDFASAPCSGTTSFKIDSA